ncbi:hypothetical protein F4781DRAFT_441994 [Annulohypoxylon bovei var. microspora]|nr:hypothetical protein F4781DRAFT_441994 [Annulohypoxylon bovei var. microspora]
MGNSALPPPAQLRKGVVVVVLLFIYAFAANALFGLLYRNGYYEALVRLRDEGPHHLPGSSNPILKFYTGIGFLDKLLTVASVMFANVTDGNAPELSLYAFHFGGQYLAILVIIAIEGFRSGSQSNSFRCCSIWGCLMQATSYGGTMPIYATIHLLTSPAAQDAGPLLSEATSISKLAELWALPQAFMLGYVIPAVLMSVPLFSNPVHQWFGGLWQGSPIFSMLIAKLLAVGFATNPPSQNISHSKKLSHPTGKQPLNSPQSPVSLARAQEKAREKDLLARAYLFAFFWCVVSQLVPLVLIMAVHIYPSAFPSRLREAWTIFNVFLPPPFWSTEKMTSMATGMHDFFLYDQYAGSTAAIVWTLGLYLNSRTTSMKLINWAKLATTIAALIVFTGPAGAAVWLMWEREQLLLSA